MDKTVFKIIKKVNDSLDIGTYYDYGFKGDFKILCKGFSWYVQYKYGLVEDGFATEIKGLEAKNILKKHYQMLNKKRN